jgi:hypothetical protein
MDVLYFVFRPFDLYEKPRQSVRQDCRKTPQHVLAWRRRDACHNTNQRQSFSSYQVTLLVHLSRFIVYGKPIVGVEVNFVVFITSALYLSEVPVALSGRLIPKES